MFLLTLKNLHLILTKLSHTKKIFIKFRFIIMYYLDQRFGNGKLNGKLKDWLRQQLVF